jgi:tetratricopeptide (TPR) repeat protein
MPLPTHPILSAGAWLSAAFLIAGCSSSDSRAQAALGEYQTAAAANDMYGARRALLRLVRAKDDVADYWMELGKVQASMGNFGEAYYAFTRAYELDRSNADLVRALTQLALRSGDIGAALRRAEELEVLAPGDPWVKLVKGWAAIGELRFGEAVQVSDQVLAGSPFDPAATVLKARALVGLNRDDEAVALLSKQAQEQPTDGSSLSLLVKIYERRADWPNVARTARQLSGLQPADQDVSVSLIRAALRSGDTAAARKESFRVLTAKAPPTLISRVLDLWADYWPSRQRVEDASRLAPAANSLPQRLAYATFLNRIGSPAEAARIAAGAATLPVTAESAEANAVLADALSRSGKLPEAKARFDAVLAFDAGNPTALRGRAELALKTGDPAKAIQDAEKLVTVLPTSARDRLLLARAYAAAGNRSWQDRTLWAAFQDIPGDESIFAALRATRGGNAEALKDLQAEFDRQRSAKLSRGLL